MYGYLYYNDELLNTYLYHFQVHQGDGTPYIASKIHILRVHRGEQLFILLVRHQAKIPFNHLSPQVLTPDYDYWDPK